MEGKEAIEFISKHIADFRERTEDAFDKEGCKKLIMEAKGVISLLQQGEAYRQIVEKWWDEMSYIKKSTIIKGGEHLCVPERSQNYEEFWDDLTPDEKIKVFDEYKNI